jgi:hypothetical protein
MERNYELCISTLNFKNGQCWIDSPPSVHQWAKEKSVLTFCSLKATLSLIKTTERFIQESILARDTALVMAWKEIKLSYYCVPVIKAVKKRISKRQ